VVHLFFVEELRDCAERSLAGAQEMTSMKGRFNAVKIVVVDDTICYRENARLD